MDIQFLRTFLEVAKTRHFGKAAENLFLTQSAISARIRFLEDAVGEPLFIRQRNNIQLSPTGEKLIPYAEGIVTLWYRAKQEVILPDKTENVLSVSCAPGLWEMILHHWLAELAKSHLSVSVNSAVYSNQELTQKLREFTLDLAFTFDSSADEHLIIKQVATIPILLVSTEKNQSIEQALSEDFVFVDWGTSINTEIANNFGDKVKPIFKLSQNNLALSLLVEHQGTAFLAEQTIRKYVQEKRLYVVKDAPRFERSVYAIYTSHSRHADLVAQSISLFEKIKTVSYPELKGY